MLFRSEVVGDCPQKIGPQLLLLCFHNQFFIGFDSGSLVLRMKSCGACHDGNEIHDNKGERVSAHGKVKLVKGISVQVVNAKNTENCSKNPIAVFVRITGNENDRQDIDQADIGGAGRMNPVVQSSQKGGSTGGTDGKKQTEVGVECMFGSDRLYKAGKKVPDIFFHMDDGCSLQRTSIFLLCSFS